MKGTHKSRIRILATCIIVAVLILGSFSLYVFLFTHYSPPLITESEARDIVQRPPLLAPLPYKTVPADLSLACDAAILIDASNGCILYEKNADEPIPPASMTKLAVMYIVFQEIAAGHVSLDDEVPLPPESWWVNLPADSSLMFLNEGQRVSLRELMLGLAVASGNDAAIAVACYISGSVEAFCARMNEEMAKLGLTHTRFVEPSGYDERNMTTPREFALFSRVYLEQFPQALSEFHSVRSIAYPRPENLSAGLSPKTNRPIVQYNTNRALSAIEGCDGLKTGFIYESGYNLALTVSRENTRLIAVFMKGWGRGTAEGNKNRVANSKTVSDWVYSSFATKKADPPLITGGIPVYGGRENAVRAITAYTRPLTVPALIPEKTPEEAAALVKSTVVLDKPSLSAPVQKGERLGSLVYTLNDTVLEEVPLIAVRNIERAGIFKRMADSLARLILEHGQN